MEIENKKIEVHPFEPFVPNNATKLIVGSFPGQEQTEPNISSEEWFYGAKRNLFWKIISDAFNVELKSKTDKQHLFSKYGIGIADILLKVEREKESNLDKYLIIKEANDKAISIILKEHNIKRILFTSKYVEDVFLKYFPNVKNYACLPSPSGGANIPISKSDEFKIFKREHPDKNTIDFRVHKYKELLT